MNRIRYIKIALFIILCFTSTCFLDAQVVDSTSNNQDVDLPAEQVEVIKLFQARLEDAKKINILPEAPPERRLEKFEYQFNIRPIELEYLDPVIKPIAMLRDPKPEKYNAFLKGGYGNLNTIYGKLGYNYLSPRETEINISADYISMDNNDRPFHEYQNIHAGLDINHNVGALLALGVNAAYKRKNINFFGSPFDGLESDTKKYNRVIDGYGFGLSAFNGETNVYNLNYKLGINYNNVSISKEKLYENNFIADISASKSLNENFSVGLDGATDISSILDTATTNYNNYFVQPSFNFVNDKFNFSGGVNFAFTRDQTYFLPNVSLSYSPIDYSFIPYIFWKGELTKNNISNLISINSFLSKTVVPALDNTVNYEYGLGIKGEVSMISYDANVSYGSVQNLILYNSFIDDELLRQFEIIKDTANVLEIEAGIEYEINDKLSVNTDFRFRNFELSQETRAWHLPSYRFDLEVRYRLLNKKLLINPRMYLRDGAYVRNEEGQEEALIPLVDFNLNVEYEILNRLSAFGQVNNFLASEYQRWDQYSQFGLNALIGLKFSF